MTLVHAALSALTVLASAACAPVGSAQQGAPDAGPVEITLSRTVCFGFCPDYTVTITGGGQVTYVGRRFVNEVGERRTTIPREDVARLLARFDAIGFDDLDDAYRARVTDMPTYTVTLVRDGRRKTVVDYAGLNAGMPEAVRELQNEIDRVAGTERWVLRDGQPVRDRPQP
jgi:hypothetical protein